MKVESRPFSCTCVINTSYYSSCGDMPRILPPLVIGDEVIEEFFEKLSEGAATFQAADTT